MVEEKEVYGDITPYLNFGWKDTGRTNWHRSGRSTTTYKIIARDTQRENYNILKSLENQYFLINNRKKYYESMEFGTVALLLLLFIFPGIIYIVYKRKQKEKYDDINYQCNKEQTEIIEKARKLL